MLLRVSDGGFEAVIRGSEVGGNGTDVDVR